MRNGTSWYVSVCVPHHCTVVGVLLGFDNAELVEHLADDDNTDPDGGQTGGHGSKTGEGHRKRPQYHQHQVHH